MANLIENAKQQINDLLTDACRKAVAAGELPEGVCIKNIVYMDINGIDSYSITNTANK